MNATVTAHQSILLQQIRDHHRMLQLLKIQRPDIGYAASIGVFIIQPPETQGMWWNDYMIQRTGMSPERFCL